MSGLSAVAWTLGASYFTGRKRIDYRHEPRILDEGEAPPNERLNNLVDFLPTGLLAGAFVTQGVRAFDTRAAAAGVRCFSGVSIGYLTAAFAPGKPGGPTDGTLRQAVHNAAGLFEYASGGAGLVLFGLGTWNDPRARWLSRLSLLAVVPYTLVLAGSGLTEQPETRKRLQGLLEGTLFGWMIAASLSLLRR